MEPNQPTKPMDHNQRRPHGQSQTGKQFEKDEQGQCGCGETDQTMQDQGREQKQRQAAKK